MRPSETVMQEFFGRRANDPWLATLKVGDVVAYRAGEPCTILGFHDMTRHGMQGTWASLEEADGQQFAVPVTDLSPYEAAVD